MIRAIEQNDLEELYRIHQKFYKDDFPFPDFATRFLCSFVVTDDDGQLITAGGVRTIAEALIITNKEISPRKRIKGLQQILAASSYVAKNSGFNNLNAFVKSGDWQQHLTRVGFKSEEVVYLEL